jgi:hypothetical protein
MRREDCIIDCVGPDCEGCSKYKVKEQEPEPILYKQSSSKAEEILKKVCNYQDDDVVLLGDDITVEEALEAMEQYGNLKFAEGRAISLDKNLNWEKEPAKGAEDIYKSERETNYSTLPFSGYLHDLIISMMEQYRNQGCQERDEIIKSSFDRIDQYRKSAKNLLDKIKKRDELIDALEGLIEWIGVNHDKWIEYRDKVEQLKSEIK